MSITKKLRFEVFKRDGFACQYCGKTPPDVTLEVDHIKPRSKKGGDEINNLITACFDCNRGKTNIELKKIPNSLVENAEIIKEKEAQYSEYCKLLKKVESRISKEIQKVDDVFSEFFPEMTMSEKFKTSSVRMFLKKLTIYDVLDSMQIAASRINDPEDALKYFCGICWNKIKDRENG
jgi:hypothetical protein